LVILIALLIWTWIWGVAGAILAVPITIATMIICAHIPRLLSVALLLSDATSFVQLDRQIDRPDH
ncbi:MAG: AI-2E family transporter, partial [Rhodobacterales bacterium]|nr:AI-2E family transporter [Rhodobacterales bacterium]